MDVRKLRRMDASKKGTKGKGLWFERTKTCKAKWKASGYAEVEEERHWILELRE